MCRHSLRWCPENSGVLLRTAKYRLQSCTPPPLPPLHRMENGMVDSDKPWVHEQRRDAYPMWCWMTEEEKNTAPIPEDTAPHHYSKYWRKYGDCQQCIKCRVLCFV